MKKILFIVVCFNLGAAGDREVLALTDTYTISGVEMNSKSATAAKSRQLGLADGQVRALEILFNRIVPTEYLQQVPSISSDNIVDLVQDVSISDEKVSEGHYMAKLTVRFNPDEIRSFLRFANIPFAEQKSKPVVVLPVYVESIASQETVWEEPNLWRDAWQSLTPSVGLVPRTLPMNDINDIDLLSNADMISLDIERLNSWAQRYKAKNWVITKAYLINGLGNKSLNIKLYFSATGEERSVYLDFSDDKSWQNVLILAAEETWSIIEDEWKKRHLMEFGVAGQLAARVPIRKLSDWLSVRNRLDAIQLIDRYKVSEISRSTISIEVFYAGNNNKLRAAMIENSLNMLWEGSEWWIKEVPLIPFDELQKEIDRDINF
ncbi:MAG: hypothetical protein CMM25_05835 [Rhodospirillaceae bacterium]|nr:hypothetical protein [Rhodospirillaceae bacterium]